MSHVEKEPENTPEFEKKPPPKLNVVPPDDLPPAAAELMEDIDSYQKQMEMEWDNAKSSYEDKINRLLYDFLATNRAAANPPIKKPTAPPPTNNTFGSSSEQLKAFMNQMDAELRRTARPETVQLGWKGSKPKLSLKLILPLVGAAVFVIATLAYGF